MTTVVRLATTTTTTIILMWVAAAWAPGSVRWRHHHPYQQTVRPAAPPLQEGSVAVLLSLNARGVSKRAVAAARKHVPAEDLFETGSVEEARIAAREIVGRGYATVVSGGGDGTLSAAVSQICAARRECGEALPIEGMPRFVVLPLGTGNAVARYVFGPRYKDWRGAKGVRRTLDALRQQRRPREIVVPVLRVDGRNDTLCFLGGCGFDSFILDDYRRLRNMANRTPVIKSLVSSVFGYFVATATSTLPQYALGNRRMRVRVTVPSGAVAYVDPRRGDAALPLASRVLYEGGATIVAAGATPYYGGGMRLFPFARAAAAAPAVNLRIARMSPWRFVPNVLRIFAGTYRSPSDALDFVGTHFSIEHLDRPIPVQHSGDALGEQSTFDLRVAGQVRFVDLLGLPPTLDHLRLEEHHHHQKKKKKEDHEQQAAEQRRSV